MAGQIPDSRSLNSWEDAFQHPLPVVRKLEQQLRKNIDDNRQKLRSLVGASYRDLLGTAERIIEMDGQMQSVETTLGDIGRKCNTRTMERAAECQGRLRKLTAGKDSGRHKAMAQTKVLQSALTMVLRLVKAGGDALQASKLLVLARLLVKNVSDSPSAPAVIGELRQKLGTARKRVLAYIDGIISKPMSDKTRQAHSLCAYALITSSTPKEVLRYFLQLRYQYLQSTMESPSERTVLQMLELYSQTLLDTRDLFPRRFADTLGQLAKLPLLKDEQVQSVFELNLDIYDSWISDDVKSFTPWVRHEQVTSAEVGDALSSWTQSAQGCVVEGLEEFLKHEHDPRLVLDTRQKVVSKYLTLQERLRNSTFTTAIDDVRKVFIARLLQLAAQSADLSGLALDDAAPPPQAQQAMWKIAIQDYDLSRGASSFRTAIIQGRHSRSSQKETELRKLDEWKTRVTTALDVADRMRGSRWNQDIEFDIDEIEASESLVDALNKNDPNAVMDKLAEVTSANIKWVANMISDTAKTTENAAYYIRIWRELDHRRRTLESRLQLTPSEFSLALLYQSVASVAVTDPIKAYTSSKAKPSHVAVTLWDGTPPLPVQPSPATFRLLSALQKAMEGVGSDLWSQQGVQQLKSAVITKLLPVLQNDQSVENASEEKLMNGHVDDETDTERDSNPKINGVGTAKQFRRERLLQDLFDAQYLNRVLAGHRHDGSSMASVIESQHDALQLDSVARERIQRSAGEYWKRTYLLLGLLAPG